MPVFIDLLESDLGSLHTEQQQERGSHRQGDRFTRVRFTMTALANFFPEPGSATPIATDAGPTQTTGHGFPLVATEAVGSQWIGFGCGAIEKIGKDAKP